jgi:hypothetical protein
MKHEFKIIPKEEVLANRSKAYEFIDFDKQETLEEAYLNKLIDEANKEFTLDRKLAKDVAIKYANWQQEQDKKLYSEEDMINRTQVVFELTNKGYSIDEIIEQFKNK